MNDNKIGINDISSSFSSGFILLESGLISYADKKASKILSSLTQGSKILQLPFENILSPMQGEMYRNYIDSKHETSLFLPSVKCLEETGNGIYSYLITPFTIGEHPYLSVTIFEKVSIASLFDFDRYSDIYKANSDRKSLQKNIASAIGSTKSIALVTVFSYDSKKRAINLITSSKPAVTSFHESLTTAIHEVVKKNSIKHIDSGKYSEYFNHLRTEHGIDGAHTIFFAVRYEKYLYDVYGVVLDKNADILEKSAYFCSLKSYLAFIGEKWTIYHDLNDTENLVSNIVDNAHNFIISVDKDYSIMIANKYFEDFTGYTSSDISEVSSWYKFLSNDQYNIIKKAISHVFSTGEAVSNIGEIFSQYGNNALVSWIYSPIMDNASNVFGVLCIGQDITTQHGTETKLSNIYSLIGTLINIDDEEEIINKTGESIVSQIYHKSVVISLNDNTNQKTVIRYSNNPGQVGKVYDISRPGSLLQMAANDGKTHQSPTDKALEKTTHTLEISVPIVNNNIVMGAIFIENEPQNTYGTEEIMFLEAFADILGIAIKNSRLKRSGNDEKIFNEKLLYTTSSLIAIVSSDELLTNINERFSTVTGIYLKNPQLISVLEQVLFENDYNLFCENIRNVFSSGNDATLHTVLSKDSEYSIVSWYISPIKNEKGLIENVICTGNDITELISLEMGLLESNHLNKGIVDNLDVPIYVIDKNHEIVSANKAFFKWINAPNEEIMNRNVFDVMPFLIELNRADDYDAVLEGNVTIHKKQKAVVSGKEKVYEVSLIPLSIPKVLPESIATIESEALQSLGKSVAKDDKIITLINDLTESYCYQKELKWSNSRLNNLIDVAGALIIGFDVKGNITLFNKAIESLTGCESSLIIGSKIWDFTNDPYRISDCDELIELTKKGQFKYIRSSLEGYDGKKRSIRWQRTCVFGENDNIDEIISVGIDITEQEAAKAELKRNEDKFFAVFENSFEAIVVLSPRFGKSGSIVGYMVESFNNAALDCFRDAMSIGKYLDEIIDSDDYYPLYQELKNSFTSKKGTQIHKFVCSFNGYSHIFNISIFPAGEYMVISMRDVTEKLDSEKKLVEKTSQLEEKNNELEKFLYKISHDLKSPMTSLRGMTEILNEDFSHELGDEGHYYVDRIFANVEKMETLIDDLLNLSRIGRIEYPIETIQIEPLIRNIIDSCISSLSPVEIPKITMSLAFNTVEYGRQHLIDVFTVLIKNAMTYVEAEKRPSISISSKLDDPNWVQFSIEDNGIGIHARYTEKIFKVFERLCDIDTEGTGVGLALAKRIVMSYGGEIWVDSVPGKGSVFHFTVPYKEEKGHEI